MVEGHPRSLRWFTGTSAASQGLEQQIVRFASSQETVLILGETGAGKSTAARALHEHSRIAAGPFHSIDCSVIKRAGDDVCIRLSQARSSGGTLCIDQIEALTIGQQQRFLHDLVTSKDMPASAAEAVTARLIVTSSHDLAALAQAGKFRTDLFYHLARFTIRVPALRQRSDDIIAMARFFLGNRDFQLSVEKSFDQTAVAAMRACHWPGNVRQLRNAVERAVIFSGDETMISAAALGIGNGDLASNAAGIDFRFSHLPTIDELQTYYVESLLSRGTFSRGKIAQVLNVSERTIYRILRARRTRQQPAQDVTLAPETRL